MLPENVTVLGDPHLGRRFKTGVPLERVGDREKSQWLDFERSLLSCSTKYHINMGDLFDRSIVPFHVILRAARTYATAAENCSSTTFFILEGNHDVSRDTTVVSAFDLFAELVDPIENIVVVRESAMQLDGFGLVPFNPFLPTEQLVAELPDGLEAVFGHWDIQDWGGHNVIPTKLLAEKGIKLAISGHDHLARTEKAHGVDIIVTGSMQPYTHAEDNTGEWYVTVTLDELDPKDVVNKNVRVLLRDGETLPENLDCLSLTAKRLEDAEEGFEVDTSDYENLDLKDMLANSLEGLRCKDKLVSQFMEGGAE